MGRITLHTYLCVTLPAHYPSTCLSCNHHTGFHHWNCTLPYWEERAARNDHYIYTMRMWRIRMGQLNPDDWPPGWITHTTPV